MMFGNGWKSPAVESGLMELCSYWGEHREVCGSAWRRLPGSLERDVGFVWGLAPPDSSGAAFLVWTSLSLPAWSRAVPLCFHGDPGAVPGSVGMRGVLSTCRGSEQGLFLCFPSLLGCDSASAGTWQGFCCCLERWCCSSGMFTEWANLPRARGTIVMNKKKRKENRKEGRTF